jgi:hypothetical protein
MHAAYYLGIGRHMWDEPIKMLQEALKVLRRLQAAQESNSSNSCGSDFCHRTIYIHSTHGFHQTRHPVVLFTYFQPENGNSNSDHLRHCVCCGCEHSPLLHHSSHFHGRYTRFNRFDDSDATRPDSGWVRPFSWPHSFALSLWGSERRNGLVHFIRANSTSYQSEHGNSSEDPGHSNI